MVSHPTMIGTRLANGFQSMEYHSIKVSSRLPGPGA